MLLIIKIETIDYRDITIHALIYNTNHNPQTHNNLCHKATS